SHEERKGHKGHEATKAIYRDGRDTQDETGGSRLTLTLDCPEVRSVSESRSSILCILSIPVNVRLVFFVFFVDAPETSYRNSTTGNGCLRIADGSAPSQFCSTVA